MKPTKQSKLRVGDLVRLSRNKLTGDRSYCQHEYEILSLSRGNTHAEIIRSKPQYEHQKGSYDIFLEEFDVFKQTGGVLEDIEINSVVTFRNGGTATVKGLGYNDDDDLVRIFFEDTPDSLVYARNGSNQLDSKLLDIIKVSNAIEWDKLERGTKVKDSVGDTVRFLMDYDDDYILVEELNSSADIDNTFFEDKEFVELC